MARTLPLLCIIAPFVANTLPFLAATREGSAAILAPLTKRRPCQSAAGPVGNNWLQVGSAVRVSRLVMPLHGSSGTTYWVAIGFSTVTAFYRLAVRCRADASRGTALTRDLVSFSHFSSVIFLSSLHSPLLSLLHTVGSWHFSPSMCTMMLKVMRSLYGKRVQERGEEKRDGEEWRRGEGVEWGEVGRRRGGEASAAEPDRDVGAFAQVDHEHCLRPTKEMKKCRWIRQG